MSPLEFSSELRLGNHIIDESLKKMNPLSPETLDLIFTKYEFKISCQNKENSISCENTFCVNDYFSVKKFTDNLKKTIKGKGSAIFLHLTQNYKPTEGCIAIQKKDFQIMLKLIKKNTYIKI